MMRAYEGWRKPLTRSRAGVRITRPPALEQAPASPGSPMTAFSAPVGRLGLAAAALLLTNPVRAADPPLPKQAHTFKTVGDLKIQADVYRADDTKARPVVVWIHGGALISGNRKSVPQNLL